MWMCALDFNPLTSTLIATRGNPSIYRSATQQPAGGGGEEASHVAGHVKGRRGAGWRYRVHERGVKVVEIHRGETETGTTYSSTANVHSRRWC